MRWTFTLRLGKRLLRIGLWSRSSKATVMALSFEKTLRGAGGVFPPWTKILIIKCLIDKHLRKLEAGGIEKQFRPVRNLRF